MPSKPDPSRAEAERLYGLPLDHFTGERDAAARELRKSGDREAAEAVGKLRKPTVAAWTVNQLARRHGDEVDALLAAGDDLRAAHEQLLAGKGGDALGRAAAAERAAVGKLIERARRLDVSPAALERVAETLHAVAGSDELRDELRRGAVTQERQAAMFGGLGLGAADAGEPTRAPKAKGKGKGKAKPETKAKAKGETKAQAEAKAKAREAERAERERSRERLKAARAELKRLRSDHGKARRELHAAERGLGRAREELATHEQNALAAREREVLVRRAADSAEAEIRKLAQPSDA